MARCQHDYSLCTQFEDENVTSLTPEGQVTGNPYDVVSSEKSFPVLFT